MEQNAIGFVSRLILVNMEKKTDAKSRSNRMLTKFLSRNRFTFLKFSTYAVDFCSRFLNYTPEVSALTFDVLPKFSSISALYIVMILQ